MNELMNATTAPLPSAAVAALILLACGIILGLVYYARMSGRLSENTLKLGVSVLDGMRASAKALAETTGSGAMSVAAFVLEAGTRAAHAAEQMYKTGEIGKDERNLKAKEIAEELLGLAGIEVTEDRKTALAVAIEAECDAMGHSLSVSGTARVTGTPQEISELAALLGGEMSVSVGEAQHDDPGALGEPGPEGAEDCDVLLPEVGTIALGYELSDAKEDAAVYVGVEGENGPYFRRIDLIDDAQADAVIRENMIRADVSGMTLEEKRALIEDFIRRAPEA